MPRCSVIEAKVEQETMKQVLALAAAFGLAAAVAGCGSDPGTRAVTGGLIGAGTGAGLAAVTHGSVGTGAVVGGGVGAVGGAVTSP